MKMLRKIAGAIWFLGLVPSSALADPLITTYVGRSPSSGTLNARSTAIGNPWGITFDKIGNLIFEAGNAVYRYHLDTGSLEHIAGDGTVGRSGDGGPARLAQFTDPSTVAADSQGNIYVGDNNGLRKIDAAGQITSIPGVPYPYHLAVDSRDRVLVADWSGGGVKIVDGGVVTPFPGVPSFPSANYAFPIAVAVTPDGTLYYIDSTLGGRRFDDVLVKVAPGGVPVDVTPGGLRTFGSAEGLVVDSQGNAYTTNWTNGILKISPTGTIDLIAGSPSRSAGLSADGVVAQGAPLNGPWDIALGPDGLLYFTEGSSRQVRRINSAGVLETLVGSGNINGSAAQETPLEFGNGALALDQSGALLFSHETSIYRVDPDTALVHPLVGSSVYGKSIDGVQSNALATIGVRKPVVDAMGNVVFPESSTGTIWRARVGGTVEKLAENTIRPGCIPATSPACVLDGLPIGSPANLAYDAEGNLYFGGRCLEGYFTCNGRWRQNDYVVRKIDSSTGIVSTVAGTGSSGNGGDGGPAALATLGLINSLVFDRQGNLYIASSNGIRRVDSQGIIATFAGAGIGYAGDGGPATAALLNGPRGLVFDADGNLFFSDTGNNVVRRIATDGTISTVVGDGVAGLAGDGGSPSVARLNFPTDLAIGNDGSLFISDSRNGRIRKVTGLVRATDMTPPLVTPEISGVAGNAGWFLGDASISWAVSDAQSAVVSTANCATAIATSDGFNHYSCTAESGGGRVTGHAVVKRDAAPPVAQGAVTTAPNAAGWNNAPVPVAFSGTDATSGIASCSPNATVATEGANQTSPTGTCTDVAGNVSAPVSLSGINIDMTAPVVLGSRSPAPNAAGWNGGSVVASFTATDALSGVAADGCDVPVTVAGEGPGQSASGFCRDIAGNSASATVRDVSIDVTGPTAAAVVTPAANAAGWHKTVLSVSFEGSDAISGSGIAGCSNAKSPTSDGASQSLSGTCTDLAGNVSSPAAATVSLDRVSPAVSVALPTDGATYGVAAVVPANFSCSDPLSGVASCAGTVAKANPFDTSTVGTKTFTVTGTDNAGNFTSQAVSYTVTAGYDNGLTTNRASIAFPSQQVLTSSTAQAITLTNPGSTPVGLRSITLGGTNGSLFSRSTTCAGTLAAGASCNINVFFRPTTMGAKTGSLIVSTTLGGAKVVGLSGAGLSPPLTISTAALAFGGQLQSPLSPAKQVGITNSWSEPVRLTSLTITGTDSTNFSRSTTCGATLAPGSFCTASVYFRPASPGDKAAQLNIASQAASSPQVVALTGTGTFLQIGTSSASLDFGFQPLFTASTAKTVTVTNTGTQLLKLTAVAITGTDASNYSRSTTCGASLAVGASCDVRVFFRPTAGGARAATLTISATGTAAKTVALGGVGI